MVVASNRAVSGEPRPSSSLCVLYQGVNDIEVLMVRRAPSARFMAGSWVFPGGVVDPGDHSAAAIACIEGSTDHELGPWLAAGVREVVEETGVWLSDPPFVARVEGDVFVRARGRGLKFTGRRMAYFANWITPTMVPVRFDARFFIAAIPEKVVPEPDEREIDAARFVVPRDALEKARAVEWLVPFPTQRILEQLARFSSVEAALDEWRNKRVVAVQPRMRVLPDGALEVVMPGESGFDELGDVAPNPDALRRAAQAAAQRGRPIVEISDDCD